jgi:hypothetical protein
MAPGDHVCFVDSNGQGHNALAERLYTGEGFDSKGNEPTIDLIYVDPSGRQEMKQVRHVSFFDHTVAGHFWLKGCPTADAEKVAKDQLEELALQAQEAQDAAAKAAKEKEQQQTT